MVIISTVVRYHIPCQIKVKPILKHSKIWHRMNCDDMESNKDFPRLSRLSKLLRERRLPILETKNIFVNVDLVTFGGYPAVLPINIRSLCTRIGPMYQGWAWPCYVPLLVVRIQVYLPNLQFHFPIFLLDFCSGFGSLSDLLTPFEITKIWFELDFCAKLLLKFQLNF